MIKTLKILSILLSVVLSSCSSDEVLTQDKEAKIISELFEEISELASSKDCEDASNLRFTAFGSKACGGPIGYIAYSVEIDTVTFLEKIDKHRILQNNYNQKWGVISDCSIPAQPSGVKCENFEPVLVYEL